MYEKYNLGEENFVLTDCDIAVNPDLPSKLNNISSMNKIVEYMALGLPIIQYNSKEGKNTAGDSARLVAHRYRRVWVDDVIAIT